jgi:acetyltransferase-like isoleucine patch superfamily enzyme
MKFNFVKFIWFLRSKYFRIFRLKFIGKSYLGKPIFITGYRNFKIGKDVRIYPLARIESYGNNKNLFIGNHVTIGQSLHLIVSNSLIIGDNSIISANVFISDTNHSYTLADAPFSKQQLITNTVKIGENNFIGYGAVILPGTRTGKNCIIGANSVIKGIFEDNLMIAGNPAKIIKKYNLVTKNWERYL